MFFRKNNGAEADLNTIVYLGQGRCNCSCETISHVTLQPFGKKNQSAHPFNKQPRQKWRGSNFLEAPFKK